MPLLLGAIADDYTGTAVTRSWNFPCYSLVTGKSA